MSVLGALWIALPYAWRVHERISRVQRKGDWPVRTSRILTQQEGSLVGYLTNLPGICAAVGVHLVGPNPETMIPTTGSGDGGLHGSREHGSKMHNDRGDETSGSWGFGQVRPQDVGVLLRASESSGIS